MLLIFKWYMIIYFIQAVHACFRAGQIMDITIFLLEMKGFNESTGYNGMDKRLTHYIAPFIYELAWPVFIYKQLFKPADFIFNVAESAANAASGAK